MWGSLVLELTEGFVGVEARGAKSRGYAGERRDGQEQEGRGDEGCRVERLGVEQQGSKVASEQSRCSQAEGEPKRSEHQSAFQDERKHVRTLRSEGHAQAQLLGALRHHVAEDAVEADGGEQKGDGGEGSEEDGLKTLLGG